MGADVINKGANLELTMATEGRHELRVNGKEFMRGDEASVSMIFGNFDGRNFTFDLGRRQTHEQWLAYMRAQYQCELKVGDSIQLLTPGGQEVQSSEIGSGAFDAWMAGIQSQLGVDDELNGGSYRGYFDKGMSPAEAVLQDRLDGAALKVEQTINEQAQEAKDGEVLGMDEDGCLIQWDAGTKTSYNSGETVEEFGRHNLKESEVNRLSKHFI